MYPYPIKYYCDKWRVFTLCIICHTNNCERKYIEINKHLPLASIGSKLLAATTKRENIFTKKAM